MNLTFSHALRVRLCDGCLGPLHVAEEGGEVCCPACGQVQLVPAREATTALGPGDAKVTESEQRARLADRHGQVMALPPSFCEALGPESLLVGVGAERLDDTLSAWAAARDGRRRGDVDDGALYFVTLALCRTFRLGGREQELRALCETALETVADARFEQMLRAVMAEEAVRAGDVTAAGDWLAPCDPVAGDIHAHSAYRFARALLCTHTRDFEGVLGVLGEAHGEVPLSGEHLVMCSLLRANAIERLGAPEEAVDDLLRSLSAAGGSEPFDAAQELNAAMALCPRTYWQARERLAAVKPARTSPAWQWGVAAVAWVLVVLALLWAFVWR